MVSPNNEIWQWESGFEPYGEGEINNSGVFTFIAEDDIQKYDVVALYSSGSEWKYPRPSAIPTVCAVGSNATDGFKTIGLALNAASSGENISVRCLADTILVMKTNGTISAGDWVRPSKGVNNEKLGCIYKCDNTGDSVIGIALNDAEPPATHGTGTITNPYNYRPVAVLAAFGAVDRLNR